MYWLQGANTSHTSGTSTPRSSQNITETVPSVLHGDSLIDLDSPSEPQGQRPFAASTTHVPSDSFDRATPSTSHSGQSDNSFDDFLDDLDPLVDGTVGEREPRQHAHTTPHSPSQHLRSPSLPPTSPTRLSHPEIQRTQSSYFTPPSFPSRWVSNLLTSTIRAPRTSPSTPPTDATSIFTPSHPDDAPFASTSRIGTFPRSAPHSRAATVSEGAPLDTAITHGTPFAPHAFVPPSGAPGFTGDRTWDKGFEFDKTQVERRSIRLTGRKEMTVPVLNVDLADQLRPFLPALARLPKSWSLLYSLDQHGISLHTLYTRCQDFKGSQLLVVKDSGESLFGAWMGEGIHPSKGAYFGSGESFLWQKVGPDRVRVFKWTGKNDYVALCEPDYISFGGGDGHYGLWLDDTLMDGSSAPCPTFDNEPLCSAGPRKGETVTFECVGLEVWGIG
ncbi:TLD-domain-containing protein [Polyporus arcularius HHB13444]|uniref:Oxidation resistance protein 1 n=1 Tax=Polyporus arcularius HHB13444 TaxID=1314778 RepID=A0A5C3NZM2_9APHY|nr:TLD-domain-containing protein [Polyporus arcularius HHB13444]